MDIQKKLEYYRTTTVKKKQPETDDKKLLAPVKAIREHFNGEILFPSVAPIIKIVRTLPGDHSNKTISLKRLSRMKLQESVEPRQCLFFDLETTGLSGGAGTYPFLMGFGFFEDDRFKIVQYFLPDFGRDYYVFREIKQLAEGRSYLVSYNGKSYDLPLLKSRSILNRTELNWERLIHIDLLHLCRRVWKNSQDSCDLGSVERYRLGINREHDIPGGLIPQAYLRFISTGVIHEMIRTIEHNYQDILSLQKLLLKLAEIEENPRASEDGNAYLRLGKLAFEIQDLEYFESIEQLYTQLNGGSSAQLKFLKSLLHKKRGEWERAVTLWEELIEHRDFMFPVLEELAKYHEHLAQDYRRALEYTERALKHLGTLQQLNPYSVDETRKSAFAHRSQRLRAKLS